MQNYEEELEQEVKEEEEVEEELEDVYDTTYLTDIIGEEYKTWLGKHILIGAGMGCGKTTFMVCTLLQWMTEQGHSVLYLCNRIALKNKIIQDVERYESETGVKLNVEVVTYQSLSFVIPMKQVYICDEAHYFCTDSSFNETTYKAFEFLRKQKTVIFMTATFRLIFELLKQKYDAEKRVYKEYYMLQELCYISKFVFFHKKQMIELIRELLTTTQDKILCYTNDFKMMSSIEQQFSEDYEVNFMCSENAKDSFASKCNKKKIVDNKFTGRLLVSTSCLDNGIEFKDREIRHVVVNMFDPAMVVQCIGRRRNIEKAYDVVNIYIRNFLGYEVNRMYKKRKEELEPLRRYYTDRFSLIKEIQRFNIIPKYLYLKSTGDCFAGDFQQIIMCNSCAYARLRYECDMLEDIIKKKFYGYEDYISEYLIPLEYDDPMGYIKLELQDKLQYYNPKEEQKRESERLLKLQKFLEDNRDCYIDELGKQKLIEICDLHDSRGRKRVHVSFINEYVMKHTKFHVKSKLTRMDGKKVRRWLIELHSENSDESVM